jgi:hypothetical protein
MDGAHTVSYRAITNESDLIYLDWVNTNRRKVSEMTGGRVGYIAGKANRGPLIDGGTIFVPESALASVKGEWIIEGYGVDPDIEVENEPKAVIAGRDPQLERGVAEINEEDQGLAGEVAPAPGGPGQDSEVETIQEICFQEKSNE